MDSNNWRPPQADQPPPPMDSGDWRTQFQPDSRQKIINKIMDTLKRHIPLSGQEGLQELKKIAVTFEEKIYSSATSQSDYLRRISVKMLTMESKSQNTIPNGLPSNATGGSRNPSDPAPSQNMQSQVHDPGKSVLVPMVSNQSQAQQQLLAQNIQNNVASTGVHGAAISLPPVSGLTSNPTPNVAQNPNLQNISGIPHSSMGNNMSQGVTSSMFANVQRQMKGRQLAQQVGMQQQPQQSQNQLMYQQQLQHQMLKQKIQHGNIQQLLQTAMQQQLPQQQNTLLQATQLQSSQQQMMQTSSTVQPSMISGMQQNQQSTIQQPLQSVLQQHQRPVLGQQQQQPHQTAVLQQQPMMPSQLQQQLMGQHPNAVNIQQNLLIGQQNNISDMQQQQQHQRLLGQQNGIPNMASQRSTNSQNLLQQQLMGQQSNISNMAHQNQVGGLAQQRQLMGPHCGSTSMQTNQHSVLMMQQTKGSAQQQCQNASSLLIGGQQPQAQAQSQQQLMSQLQSQPAQLQQHLGMQQQPNSFQQNMQPQIQTQNPSLQQQNMIDQEKQLFQPQRAPPEAPSTSLDSTAQTGSTSVGDWQEEAYQKIKVMKDLYYADLNEIYPKVSIKLQQLESLPQPSKVEQLEKLRQFKLMLEKLMQFLRTTKNSISPIHRDKSASVEKQIVSLLNSHRARKPMPPMQLRQVHQSMQQPQQPDSPLPQAQSHDSGVKPQLQSINSQGAVATVQPSNVSNMQNGSMPSLSAIASSQQSTVTSLQSSSKLDSVSGTTPNSMQQVAMPAIQQNLVSTPQQANINPLQSQSGVNLLQQNINPLQSNSNMLQSQHLKQQHDQQMMQTHQLKQQLQNRHLQQQLQKQQMLQQQQLHLQAKQQRLHLQAKQQQATQMHAHQMPELHQLHDVNDVKMRQGLGLRSGVFPSHLSSGQRYAHQQLKPGVSFPISSPQLLPAVSAQINQHSSPQIDQQNVPPAIRTPLQSANSPFAPSPSTPTVSSPTHGDPETPVVTSLSNAANVNHQQTNVAPGAPQSLSIGTPGISPSPFLECGAPDGTHGNASAVLSGKSGVTEQPLERLLKAVKSISPKALTASVRDIESVVNMIDSNAGSAPGNVSTATVGEDLVAMTKCRMQARNFLTQDGTTGIKRVRHCTNGMLLNFAASAGSMNDSFKQLTDSETSELESTATSSIKKARMEVHHSLFEEIREINECLIDTCVDISDEDADLSVASTAVGSEGTVVRCCFSAISLSPSLKSLYTSVQMLPIQPFRMLVPSNYPNCSPILLDSLPFEVSREHEDLSVKAKSRFRTALRRLSQPMSLKEIARTWDDCARAVISDYVQQNSGGTFSSKYGNWENCLSTA